MKILIIILAAAALLAALGFFLFSPPRPMGRAEFSAKVKRIVEKGAGKKGIPYGQVLLVLPEKGLRQSWNAGEGRSAGSPFHTASVGKLFTAVLTARLVEKGALGWDSPAADYLSRDLLQGLFVLEGVDHAAEVTVSQLLSHTSGAADYFSGPVGDGDNVETLMSSEPDRSWAPEELVRFSAENQTPLGAPGEVHSYSDTGYILLGLILEEIYRRPFHQILKEEIFIPLGMADSSLVPHPSGEIPPFGPALLNGVDVSAMASLSADWAGGGVVTTLEDLARFGEALAGGEILQRNSLERMFQFDHRFMRGIHYGLGFMEYRFGEFFPTLKGLPVMRGHMGILGTQLMVDFESGTVLVINYASTDGAAVSVKTAIQILALAGALK